MSLSPPFDLINTGGSASLLDYNSGYTDNRRGPLDSDVINDGSGNTVVIDYHGSSDSIDYSSAGDSASINYDSGNSIYRPFLAL
jgi:hypothetical protein